MMAEQNHGAHSARVEMRLFIEGASLGITHMGPDFVLVESPVDMAPGRARVFLKVDDSESQRNVWLPKGISKDCNRVALALSE
jgi:hypothetical protein